VSCVVLTRTARARGWRAPVRCHPRGSGSRCASLRSELGAAAQHRGDMRVPRRQHLFILRPSTRVGPRCTNTSTRRSYRCKVLDKYQHLPDISDTADLQRVSTQIYVHANETGCFIIYKICIAHRIRFALVWVFLSGRRRGVQPIQWGSESGLIGSFQAVFSITSTCRFSPPSQAPIRCILPQRMQSKYVLV
jgi:hypothetical protein